MPNLVGLSEKDTNAALALVKMKFPRWNMSMYVDSLRDVYYCTRADRVPDDEHHFLVCRTYCSYFLSCIIVHKEKWERHLQ